MRQSAAMISATQPVMRPELLGKCLMGTKCNNTKFPGSFCLLCIARDTGWADIQFEILYKKIF